MSGAGTLDGLSVASLHELLRAGTTTAADVVRHHLARIAALDVAGHDGGPALGAVVAVSATAVADAETLDEHLARTGELVGPLHGVPVLVKDQAETAGLRTAFGSALFADWVPDTDATLVTRLRAAGAVVLAKTAMCDFAAGWFSSSSLSGHTRNPHDPTRDSGGSSAGTGAGIAAELGLVGVGEDTGGSIRVPSAFCGLYGLRPTTGLVPRTGLSPLVHFQDTPGPMGRCPADVAVLLDVIAGYDPADPLTAVAHSRTATASGVSGGARYADAVVDATFAGARVGVLESSFGTGPESAEVNDAVRTALAVLAGAGAAVVGGLELADTGGWVGRTSLYAVQSKTDVGAFLRARPSAPVTSFEEVYASGVFHSENDLFHDIHGGPEDVRDAADYWYRRAQQHQLREQLLALMAGADAQVLAQPTVQVPAPTHDDLAAGRWTCLTFPTNTVLASQSGLPAISIPVGTTPGGVPVGLELIGPPLSEPLLLRLAAAWEAAALDAGVPRPVPALPAVDPVGHRAAGLALQGWTVQPVGVA